MSLRSWWRPWLRLSLGHSRNPGAPARRPRKRFLPRLETLEERCQPTVTINEFSSGISANTVYGQRVNAQGQAQWGVAGIPVADTPGRKRNLSMCCDSVASDRRGGACAELWEEGIADFLFRAESAFAHHTDILAGVRRVRVWRAQ